MPNTEETRIRETIQTYFDSLFESNQTKFIKLHPNARISGDTPQGFFEMTVADFASFVEAQPAARDAGETPFLEVLSLDIHGLTAVARVRDDYIGNRYLDTLSFVKTDDRWSIYNKLFHIEGPAGG